MSPAELTKRVTRSSTQSQTLKAHTNAETRQVPVKAKGTRRINKHRKRSTNKAERITAGTAKSKPDTKSARNSASDAANRDHGPRPNKSPTPPNSITTFSLNSKHLKTPIICHKYTPSSPTPHPSPLLFTHGAAGTLSAPAITNFCTGFSSTSHHPLLAFQGSMNLGARVKGFRACSVHVRGLEGGADHPLLLGGRSMGARAAVMAATEYLAAVHGDARAKLVLLSYPLRGPKDVRDQVLLDLPESADVLFIVGGKDSMCPLELLKGVRRKMRGRSRVVVVRGADHGMNVRPASRTREVGEHTGRVAAFWLDGQIEGEGQVIYVSEEE